MLKSYKINGNTYQVHMLADYSENHITIKVLAYPFNLGSEIVDKKYKDKFFLKIFGQTLEKRVQRGMRKAHRKMNKHAGVNTRKHDKIEKAYNNTREIYTLDEHLNL